MSPPVLRKSATPALARTIAVPAVETVLLLKPPCLFGEIAGQARVTLFVVGAVFDSRDGYRTGDECTIAVPAVETVLL